MSQGTPVRVVLDTNVLLAAARSRRGASFALVSSIPAPEFQPCLSVALYAEWQDVLTRPENLPPGRTADDALAFEMFGEGPHLFDGMGVVGPSPAGRPTGSARRGP